MNHRKSKELSVPIAFIFVLTIFISFESEELTGQDENRFLEQIKKNHDSNNDGVIDKAEAKGLLKRNFDRFDLDNDGKLDASEQKKLVERLSKEGRQNRQRNPENRMKIPETVVFETDISYREGNPKWKLDLAMPRPTKSPPKNYPAIVFVHGGGWRGGDKASGVFRSYPIEFAQKGYVCISVNYRLSQEAAFPACIEDCKCAVRWLRANADQYNVDPNRIGAYGNSAGAHLVSMLGLVGKDADLEGDGPHQKFSSMVQAVVPSATPADFSVWAKEHLSREKQLLAGEKSNLDKRAKAASPVTYANKNAPPFLIFHGTADRTVPVDQGHRLRDALKNAGAKEVTYKEYKGAGHGVFRQHAKETLPLMEKFFEKHLKSKQKSD